MPQRFKMPDAFYRSGNRFLIDDISRTKRYGHAKTVLNHTCQYFQLYVAHQLCLYLLQLFLPDDMKLRLLFLQLAQPGQHHSRVAAIRQQNLIRQHRL